MKQTPEQTKFDAVALKMFPVGCHTPTLTWLRTNVAKVLEQQVTSALIKQREEAFPDLQKFRIELEQQKQKNLQEDEDMKKKHRAKQEELARLEERLKNLETSLAARQLRLDRLVYAFERYLEWLDGEGEVDENGKRFNALREAYRVYKEHK